MLFENHANHYSDVWSITGCSLSQNPYHQSFRLIKLWMVRCSERVVCPDSLRLLNPGFQFSQILCVKKFSENPNALADFWILDNKSKLRLSVTILQKNYLLFAICCGCNQILSAVNWVYFAPPLSHFVNKD